MNSTYAYIFFAFVSVLVIALGIYYISSLISTTQIPVSSMQVSVRLTDPSDVPLGTTSLTINYSEIYLHVIANGSSEWITENSSGSINLLALVNRSAFLGIINLSGSLIIEGAGFNISAASITINESQHDVIASGNRFLVNVSNQLNLNRSASVLIDLNPTILIMLTANAPLFVIVPSLGAIIENNSETIPLNTGKNNLNPVSHSEMNLLNRARPNISITSAFLGVFDNFTSLSLTVRDNSNASIALNSLKVYGPLEMIINETDLGILNDTLLNFTKDIANFSVGLEHNISENGREFVGMQGVNFLINSNGALFLPFNRLEAVSSQAQNSQTVSSSLHCGTILPLLSPKTESQINGAIASCVENNAFILGASQSATLSFNDIIRFGFGALVVKPIIGDSYKIILHGNSDSAAIANTSAN